jgi:hypothetical protein
MKLFKLTNMIKGWFVGDITPVVYSTKDCEVAIKRYSAGEKELKHHHKLAKEITVIISGKVKMNGVEYVQDDILLIEPNESTDFEVIEDTVTCVVKSGSYKGDKYIDEN